MAGWIMPQKAPTLPPVPPAPTLSDPVVQTQVNEETRLRQREGRASTYLTDPSEQMEPGPSRTRRLLGGV